MNEHDDLERTVARSLRQRTERVSTSEPDLDGVWAHVDRRRNRRRHVAAVGSLAVVAVGALGITALGSGDPDRIPAPAAAPDLQAAWRCTNQLDYFEEGSPAVFFATCEPTEIDGAAPIFDLPTPTTAAEVTATSVPLYPTTTTFVCRAPTTAPATSAPEDAVAPTVPCSTFPTDDTVFPSTTTSIYLGGVPVTSPPRDTLPAEAGTVPTSTVAGARAPYEQSYTLVAGDSLAAIAERFGFTLEQLVNYNQFPDGLGHLILPGDLIKIPPGGVIVDQTAPVTTTTSMP